MATEAPVKRTEASPSLLCGDTIYFLSGYKTPITVGVLPRLRQNANKGCIRTATTLVLICIQNTRTPRMLPPPSVFCFTCCPRKLSCRLSKQRANYHNTCNRHTPHAQGQAPRPLRTRQRTCRRGLFVGTVVLSMDLRQDRTIGVDQLLITQVQGF